MGIEGEANTGQMGPGEPWLLRVERVAQLLGVSRSLIFEMIGRGELPSIRVGGCRRVVATELRAWIEDQAR
jgi:excisionase family DNA binding protein